MSQLSNVLKPVLDIDEVVALEQRIAAAGTPLLELMKRAGSALAACVQGHMPAPERVVVLAGSGNNGGDGWIAARLLRRAGYGATLVTRRAARDIEARPARDAAALACEDGIDAVVSPGPAELERLLSHADVVIDAILGTGFSGDIVRAPYSEWIEAANRRHEAGACFALAADVPSGLSAQEGTRALPTFTADCTVTMLAVKPGLLAPNAHEATGTLLLAPLDGTEA